MSPWVRNASRLQLSALLSEMLLMLASATASLQMEAQTLFGGAPTKSDVGPADFYILDFGCFSLRLRALAQHKFEFALLNNEGQAASVTG